MNQMYSTFSTRYGSVKAAVVMAAVNRTLSVEDRHEMYALRARVNVGRGNPLISFFKPGHISLSGNGNGVNYYADYDEKVMAVYSDAEWDDETRLFMTYYIRSLPLEGFAEDYEMEQEELRRKEEESLNGGALDSDDSTDEVFEDASDGLAWLTAGLAENNVIAAQSSDDEDYTEYLESKINDIGECSKTDKTSEFVLKDVGFVEKPRYQVISVESIEEAMRKSAKYGISVKSEVHNDKLNQNVQQRDTTVHPKVNRVPIGGELWDASLPIGVDCVVLGDGIDLLNSDTIFSSDADKSVVYSELVQIHCNLTVDDYMVGVLSVNDTEASKRLRRVTAYGEAFIAASYVLARVRSGWSVSQIAIGKTVDLTSSVMDGKYVHFSALKMSDLPGSKKNKLRWLFGRVALASEKKAAQLVRQVFPEWYQGKRIVTGWHDNVADVFACFQSGSLEKQDAWFLGVMAEYGDALLTLWLYSKMVLKVGESQHSMQVMRSRLLSNNMLSGFFKSIYSVLGTEHMHADCFEALAAIMLIEKGYGALDSLMQFFVLKVDDVKHLYN